MKKRANPDSEPNIRRIDSKRKAYKQTHGFQVHFLRGKQTVTRMFSDSIFGGKEGARRAARKFKREVLGELPERIYRGSAVVKPSSASKGRKSAARPVKSAKTTRSAKKTPASRKSAKRR
jgi:hypothetical protein